MRTRLPTGLLCVLILTLSTGSGFASRMSKQPGIRALPRSHPEAQGVSSQAILSFLNEAEKNNLGLHSFMLVRHGYVIAEGWWQPYTARRKHMLFSASKSFTSTAVGLAIAEGRLSLDDPVISFFPQDVPETISENLAAMRVKHLLTMSTGQEQDLESLIDPTVFDPSLPSTATGAVGQHWAKEFLAIPVKNRPGSQFFYSSGATYMLSAIVQKTTGQTLLEYLQPHLFKPLGITGATWETDPQGVNTGGWGLRLSTEDLARFGLLYLQQGIWNGQRLLPAQWVREATSPQIRTVASPVPVTYTQADAANWYGYLFWINAPGGSRADGAFGQLCIVLPEHDAVIAITGEYYDSQKIVRLVWSHLLPALKIARLPGNRVGRKQLARKLAGLTLLPRMGFSSCPVERVSGHPFRLQDNALKISSITFHFSPGRCDFVTNDDTGEHLIRSGINKWFQSYTDIPGMPPRFLVTSPRYEANLQVAASGTWINGNTFDMTWRFPDTPHSVTVHCRFLGDKVRLEFESSLSNFFKPTALFKGQNLVLEGQLCGN